MVLKFKFEDENEASYVNLNSVWLIEAYETDASYNSPLPYKVRFHMSDSDRYSIGWATKEARDAFLEKLDELFRENGKLVEIAE